MKNPHKTRKVRPVYPTGTSFCWGQGWWLCNTYMQQRDTLFLVWLSVAIWLLLLIWMCFLWSQSVYGLQNDIRTHSPTHTPAPEAKQPTEEELQEQVRPDGGTLLLKTGTFEVKASTQIATVVLIFHLWVCLQFKKNVYKRDMYMTEEYVWTAPKKSELIKNIMQLLFKYTCKKQHCIVTSSLTHANCSLLWFQISFWQLQLDRHRLKMSKVAERWAILLGSLFSLALDLFIEPLNGQTWRWIESPDDLGEWSCPDDADDSR